jgi:hypothetical protein
VAMAIIVPYMGLPDFGLKKTYYEILKERSDHDPNISQLKTFSYKIILLN